MHLALDDERVDDVADVVDGDIGADLRQPRLGVDLHSAQVRPVRVGEVHRVERRVRVQAGLDTVGQVVRGERRERDLPERQALVGALHGEPTSLELEVVDARLEQVSRDRLGLLDDLVRGLDDGLTTDDQGARPIGVQTLVRDLGVAVQDLDVLEGDPESVGNDLAPRRLVTLPVRRRSRDDLDLAGREHPDLGVLPAAGAVRQ